MQSLLVPLVVCRRGNNVSGDLAIAARVVCRHLHGFDLHGLEVWDLVVLGGTLGDREEREERDEREHEPPAHDA